MRASLTVAGASASPFLMARRAGAFLMARRAGDSATVVPNPYLYTWRIHMAYTHGLCTWPIHMAYTHAYSYAYTHGLYTWLPFGLSTYSSSLPGGFRLGVGTFVPLSPMVLTGEAASSEDVSSSCLAAARLAARWAVGDIGSGLTSFCSLLSSASSRAPSEACLRISTSSGSTVLCVCVCVCARARARWHALATGALNSGH